MIRLAVCDDNPLHAREAERLASGCLTEAGKPYRVQRFSSAEEMLEAVDGEEYAPDIAVLDIEMGGEDGISLARKLNGLLPGCRIIFFTSFVDYAPDVYEAEHIWFVVKNRAEEHFGPAMRKALASLEEASPAQPGILVREKGAVTFVPLSDILYLGKVGRKTVVRCLGREYSDTRRPALLIPASLKDILVQCHQGYWINLRQVREIDHGEFVLTDGTRLPISRSFRDDVRKRFFETIA